MSGFPLFATLPNLITIARLFLVPAVISMIIDSRWEMAFLLFLVAGVSDAVDGFLAKRYHLTTELGAYLDPVADKALLVSIFVALAVVRVIPSPLAILVVSRDVMIIGAILIARVLDRPMAIRPLPISKVNTTVQIAFAAAMLGAKAFDLDLGMWLTTWMVIVAGLTLASAAAYLTKWLSHMAT
jgi:cardiolipin synthase